MRDLVKVGLVTALVIAAGCKPRSDSTGLKADGDAAAQAASTDGDDKYFREGSYLWDYDSGPDPQSPMGKELAELHASIPSFPGLSNAVYGDQMFRPAFGPIPWRFSQKPNSVKILFIGQDGTHIAEAANRPATAGFGGRAQDLAKYFGVGSSAAFINAYAFTIRWQYGAFDTPFVSFKSGSPQLNFGSFTGNPVWLISQDQSSPLVKWRNQLISWIIRNNKDSLKLVVLFGGASRDAMAQFVISKGGAVGTRYSQSDLAKIKIPEYGLTGAGSNKQTSFLFTRDGKDLYKEMNGGAMPNYTDPNSVKTLQTMVRQTFNGAPDTYLKKIALPGDVNGDGKVDTNEPVVGLNGSGMIHEAQLGGFDIDNRMQINGQATNSLKGLKISDDVTLAQDVLVTQLPHPTALSMMDGPSAAAAVKEGLAPFIKYAQAGWEIEADKGFKNTFKDHAKDPNDQANWYKYARGDMGTLYYDFGAPNSRMVNVSTASRSGKDTIIFGTREKPNFDQNELKQMKFRKASKQPPDDEQWISRASSMTENRRYTFDPGPPVEAAKIMKAALPQDKTFVKPRDVNGDFGHYRGTFKDPQVVIIADPHGFDDLNTARALSGSRGQFLHTVLANAGVGDKYLVIKTAPYAQDGLWNDTVEKTKAYREQLFDYVFRATQPKLIIVDGASAAAEVERLNPASGTPRVVIQRSGNDPMAGIAAAVEEIKTKGFASASFNNKMTDLPRSHLTYYARVWEGTSGDRVINATGQYQDKAFAVVAPTWAFQQKYAMPASDSAGCKELLKKVNDGKLRAGEEPVPAYLKRVSAGSFVPTSTAKCSGSASGEDVEGAAAGGTSVDKDADVAPVPEGMLPSEDKNQHLPFQDDRGITQAAE